MTPDRDSPDHLRLIRHLFDAAAERHTHAVEPVLAPLYDDFVRYAAPHAGDRVLDVGTGTGPIARRIVRATPQVRSVIGVDIAHHALIVACGSLLQCAIYNEDRPHPPAPSPFKMARGSLVRDQVPLSNSVGEGDLGGEAASDGDFEHAAIPPASFAHADLHHLPCPAQTFTLITASFGLNAADPTRALRELRRVITPGGRIAIQEWGPITLLDQAVIDVLADFRVPDPPPDLANLRAWLARDLTDRRWTDFLQDADDYADWLSDWGFEVTDTREHAPVTIPVTVDTFIAYALARTDRAEELRAMDAAARSACESALRARLSAYTDESGVLRYQPVVIRAAARVPD